MDSGTNHGHHAFYHTVMREDFVDPTPDSEVPTSQFISEGNGGEFRKSYHGYPKVHASSSSPLYHRSQGFCSTGRIPDNVPHPADAD